nr:MAG TPA: hypothetical protein [Bacteriophage sp.]
MGKEFYFCFCYKFFEKKNALIHITTKLLFRFQALF